MMASLAIVAQAPLVAIGQLAYIQPYNTVIQ